MRTRKEESKSGAPAWMCTYGDMVTLILTFFILLFSFSTIDTKKWEDLVASFTGNRMMVIQPLDPGSAQAGFDMPTPRPTVDPDKKQQEEEFDELYQRIRDHIIDNKLEQQLGVVKVNDVILLRITDSALFDSGQAVIKPAAADLLRKVALIFDQYEANLQTIRIEGHTDNVPIHTAQFESNWELSTARATRVLQFFLNNSIIPPSKYACSGYGEYHPVAENTTETGKALNRRVDFVIEGIQKTETEGNN